MRRGMSRAQRQKRGGLARPLPPPHAGPFAKIRSRPDSAASVPLQIHYEFASIFCMKSFPA